MFNFILVGIGGGLGAMMRYGTVIGATRIIGTGFPYGTMIVNILGSFAMGILIAVLARFVDHNNKEIALFVATGFLGGFTTFSAFSLDAVTLYERGDVAHAALYIAVSVVISIGALFAGLLLVRSFG